MEENNECSCEILYLDHNHKNSNIGAKKYSSRGYGRDLNSFTLNSFSCAKSKEYWNPLLSRRQAAPKPEELIKNLDEKVVSIKEDIESIIEELRNDVTAKGNEIEENKKLQEEGLVELNETLAHIKEEFKEDGITYNIHWLFVSATKGKGQ